MAQWFWKRFLNFVSVFSGLNSLPSRFFNFVHVFFCYLVIMSPCKRVWPLILINFYPKMLCAKVRLKLALWFCRRRFLNFIKFNVFMFMLLYDCHDVIFMLPLRLSDYRAVGLAIGSHTNLVSCHPLFFLHEKMT